MAWAPSVKDFALAQARQSEVRQSMMAAKAESHKGTHRDSIAAEHMELRLKGNHPTSALGRFIFHPRFEKFGGCVVLFNFMIMTMETHATATEDAKVMRFVTITNQVLLVYYTVEVAVRLYVTRMRFFLSGWNNMDIVIVVTGLMSEVLEVAKIGGSGMDQIAMLKSLRMLRLLRLVRLLVAFRELYVLVAGLGRCMKTLFWAGGLIFVVLNVWAILSVEFLDVRVRELVAKGEYKNCAWCTTAFTNIWYANLTWFQIVSTADWTPIGRPLVEAFFWPYVFFVLNIFVVIWGLLNLVVAAIVDSNLAAREDDVAIAAKFAAHTHEEAWNSFASLCEAMDEDGSGDVSVDEFKKFVKDNVELQQHLTIMGVQEKDVDDLLLLMDEDGSGKLEHSEFVEQFTTMRTLVEKTTLFFLLKFCQSIQSKLIQQREEIKNMCADVTEIRRTCNSTILEDDPAIALSEYSDDDRHFISSCATENVFAPAQSEKREGSSVAVSGALRKSANASKVGTPDVGTKTLPAGWYYFGSTLPLEASIWCKAMNASRDDVPEEKTKVVTTEAVVTDGHKWEPLPPTGMHGQPAKQGSDDQFHSNPRAKKGSVPEVVDRCAPTDGALIDDAFFAQTPLQLTTAALPWNANADRGLQDALAITPHASSAGPTLHL